MLYNKVTFEDSEVEEGTKDHKPYGTSNKMTHAAMIKIKILKSLIIGGVLKAVKLKGSLLHESNIEGDNKLKYLFMVARKRSSKLKIWALGVAYLMLLCTIGVQLRGFGGTVKPALFNTSSAFFSLPPQSTYLLSFLAMLPFRSIN